MEGTSGSREKRSSKSGNRKLENRGRKPDLWLVSPLCGVWTWNGRPIVAKFEIRKSRSKPRFLVRESSMWCIDMERGPEGAKSEIRNSKIEVES